MKLKHSIAIALLGGALSVASGHGILALVSDSITSSGNEISSGGFNTPAPLIDLRAVRVARTTDCATLPAAAFLDSPTMPVVFDDVPFNVDAAADDVQWRQDDQLCLRNFGTQRATLAMGTRLLTDVEVGACSDAEAAAEGSASCADGQGGELAPVVTVGVEFPTGQCGSHPTVGATVPLNYLDVAIAGDGLAPGETCTAAGWVRGNPTPHERRQAAQSDRVTFDFYFRLVESSA